MKKSEARKVLKAIQAIRKQISLLNKITEQVVKNDIEKEQDEMQSSFWQNVQYMTDSVCEAMNDSEGVQWDCEEIIELK